MHVPSQHVKLFDAHLAEKGVGFIAEISLIYATSLSI